MNQLALTGLPHTAILLVRPSLVMSSMGLLRCKSAEIGLIRLTRMDRRMRLSTCALLEMMAFFFDIGTNTVAGIRASVRRSLSNKPVHSRRRTGLTLSYCEPDLLFLEGLTAPTYVLRQFIES